MTLVSWDCVQVYQVTHMDLSQGLYTAALPIQDLRPGFLLLSLSFCLPLGTDPLPDWLPLYQLFLPLCGVINVIGF